MTEERTDEDVRQQALRIHELLVDEYGERDNRPDRDPVATLVGTILSQNTNDHNRDIAYTQLRDRFPTWPEVRDAEEKEVVEVIRPAGLAPTKAPRIQSALRAISEGQGRLSLDFLKDMSLEEARNWLLDLNGVGPKTAAIVLLFALDRPAFPVDTHVHRVTQRLGLIPEGTSREKAHDLLEDLLPEDLYFTFHLNIIEHGRTVCKARSPQCDVCVLRDLCKYYREKVVGEDAS
jgi:endonuclease-3